MRSSLTVRPRRRGGWLQAVLAREERVDLKEGKGEDDVTPDLLW